MTSQPVTSQPVTSQPVVSVVVPFFDSEQTLAACIESLLVQDGIDGTVEILLVDNGSSDRSAEIAARYPELTMLTETAPGAYAARNTAIRHAGASLLAFTDADCVVDRGWLAAILEVMQDPATAVALGHCRYPAEASLLLRLLGAYENVKARYVIERCRPAHRFAYANNMAVRASVFRDLGPFKPWRRAGDTELVHRLAAHRPNQRLAYEPSMRVTHVEFVRARHRARRLSLYTETNAQIDSFRELSWLQRLGLVRFWWSRGG